MEPRNGILANSLAVVLLAGSMAPATDNAWPLGRSLFVAPTAARSVDANITVRIVHKGGGVRQVKAAGRVYTVMPHGALSITVPEGTEVFAVSGGFGHHAGDLLFAVKPSLKGDAVSID
jgi:hypothetical protein